MFSILFDEKIPYWDVMFAGATVVNVAINNSPEMVSLFVALILKKWTIFIQSVK